MKKRSERSKKNTTVSVALGSVVIIDNVKSANFCRLRSTDLCFVWCKLHRLTNEWSEYFVLISKKSKANQRLFQLKDI